MSETDLGDTQELSPADPEQSKLGDTQTSKATDRQGYAAPQNQESKKAGGGGRLRLAFALLLGLLVFASLGALGGAQAGIQAREDQERLDRAVEAVAQYQLGDRDLAAHQCEIARQRFEYVIELNPNYPGAADKLAQSMLCVGINEGSAAEATLAPTATFDGRTAEEIFPQALGYFEAQNWDALLPLLDTLRGADPDYEALKVDRMYYLALRNRGATRILSLGELEGGIFDLNQAEQIGPLDVEAANYRDWAILYIIGQSFWDVDWGQAVQFFGQIAAVAPNLSDANFYTAQNRLRDAQIEYAAVLVNDALFLAGGKSWCDAQNLLATANSYSPHSPEIQVTAQWVIEKCIANPDQ